MLTALRQLFSSLTPTGRFWLALSLVAATLTVIILLTLTGHNLDPLWAILAQ